MRFLLSIGLSGATMWKLLPISLLFVSFSTASAQIQTNTPQPQTPAPTSTPAVQPVRVDSRVQRQTQVGRFPQNFPLNPLADSDRLSARVVQLQWMIAPMYRKPGSKETAAVAPSPVILQQYAEFAQGEGSGVVRLVPDRGCVFSERVVNVKEDCLKYSFPGAGNSFSFRTEGYRLRHLADLTYSNEKLRITGIFMHGMAVDLGDVAIGDVSLSTDGMKFLMEFQPSITSENVVEVDLAIARGIKTSGFVYSKEVDPSIDRTFALRAVAYRGKVVRSAGGVRYNELDYDKRRDVIVAFRVVHMDDQGITLVWRKLSDAEPPRIKMPKADEKDDSGDEAN